VDGNLEKRDADSLLGVRVDYAVSGDYAKSLLHQGQYRGTDLFTRRPPADHRGESVPGCRKQQRSKILRDPEKYRRTWLLPNPLHIAAKHVECGELALFVALCVRVEIPPVERFSSKPPGSLNIVDTHQLGTVFSGARLVK
jgi:hypothetical protein